MKIQKQTVLDAARLAGELNRYKGASIEQVMLENNQNRLYLVLHNPNTIIKFIVEKGYAYIGLAEIIPDELVKPERALSGYSVLGAIQLELDRIVAIKLEREDRLGRKQTASLIFEIMPNKGDALLVDDSGAIKWSLKKRDGHYKTPPKLKKATVLNFDSRLLQAELTASSQIKDEIFGLSDRDLINLNLEKYESVESALVALRSYVEKASRPGPAWVIFKDEETIGFSLHPPILLPDESTKEFESALAMYENYYSQGTTPESEQDDFAALSKILDKEIARERSKASSIQKELENAKQAHTFKRYGNLILGNIDSIKKGAKAANIDDLIEGVNISIELDPAKSAAANAERYFKLFKKAVSSVNVLTSRLDSTQKRISKLEDAKARAGDNKEMLEIELLDQNLLSKKHGPAKKKLVERRLPYKRFKASSGWEIWVGRTNMDNDELTFKLARKDDYWFHAWQAAGSHTVLRLPEKHAIPDKQTLLEAAALAAYFSKARTSSKVPVAYTQVKFVHKPKKFPPGKVLIEKEKQLMVHPADPQEYMIKEEE